jgi:hypothetical protein
VVSRVLVQKALDFRFSDDKAKLDTGPHLETLRHVNRKGDSPPEQPRRLATIDGPEVVAPEQEIQRRLENLTER